MDRDELEAAFLEHRRRIDDLLATGEWHRYADEFTPDAVYRRSGTPDVVGREAIREWVVLMMTTYPGSHIARMEIVWHVVDVDLGSVVYELRSTMIDPGDGSAPSASTTASIHHAGDGLWDWVVEANNPRAFQQMWEDWSAAARRSGGADAAPAGAPLTDDHLYLDRDGR